MKLTKWMMVLVTVGLVATPVMAGLSIKLTDSPLVSDLRDAPDNWRGGPFNATVVSGPIGNYQNNDVFVTFCLEAQESLNFNIPYNVVVNDRAILGGVGPAGDPLAPATAWLYTQWMNGSIASTQANAVAVQQAIWFLENEAGGVNNAFAVAALASGWTTIGNVRVLNLTASTGKIAQDVLVMTPAPAAAGLVFVGLGLIGWFRRKLA